MHASISDSLQKFSVEIQKRLDPDTILPNLEAKRLLSETHRGQLVDKHSSKYEKRQYLLFSVLLQLSESHVQKFLDCLKETSTDYAPHEELLKIIQKGRLCLRYIFRIVICRNMFTCRT